MKHYAAQIPTDRQESDFRQDDYYDNVIITGNKNFVGHNGDKYYAFIENLANAAYEVDGLKRGLESPYKSKQEVFDDLLCKSDGKPYTEDEMSKWRILFYKFIYNYRNWNKADVCTAMSMVYGKTYDYMLIKGCCQGDWNYAYYPTDEYSEADIKNLEVLYFNLGTEWHIHDSEVEPESPNDISGYCYYSVSTDTDVIRKELCDVIGCDEKDLVMWAFDDYIRMPRYNRIESAQELEQDEPEL